MERETTRRALLSAVLGAGVGGMALSDARSYLRRFEPGSGTVWGAATENAPEEVSSPHGPAAVRYDDYHVPHVEADSEPAAYYAVGYCHGADRLFQMDLYRRLLTGHLSEVVGGSTVDSDAFHRQMDFEAAAAATWDRVAGTETGDVVEAYVAGVNHAREAEPTPLEYRLLDFEPEPWTPTASLLISKQISWGLTGLFRTLRRALARDRLGAEATEQLYPRTMDHETPILGGGEPSASMGGADAATPDPGLVSWLADFESDPEIGSNSWVVSGEHTASGDPVVANDPHLELTVPPVWYEQHVVGPEFDARGVAFPGVPFVVIGQNHAGAWGFTNAGADTIDFYAYDTVDGDGYRYGDETRQFDARTETIEVAAGGNREIEVKRSVHGAVLTQYPDGDDFERTDELGVAWTGLSATRTVEAVRELNHSDGVDEAEAAIRKFDEPTQCFVYADRDGNTYFWVTGQIPTRRTDGEPVRGTRIFDGSAREGEWGDGYTPYGESSWDGFLSHEEKPGVRNPDYLATANQRIVNDPEHYLSEGYAPPFRGKRIYDRLDARAASDEPMDAAFHRDLQLDVVDGRYDLFRPIIEEAIEAGVANEAELDAPAPESLLDWDAEMRPDAVEPLLFDQWLRDFRERTFGEAFDDAELPVGFPEPNDWVLGTLPADHELFDGDRAAVAAEALGTARARIDDRGWETYGDWNRVRFTHPFDQPFLNYDERPTAGSGGTVRNFHSEASTGSSWRMVATFDGDSRAILPGGNSGDYFSAHYDDQLSLWADGAYKSMARTLPDGVDRRFTEGD
ncbi:MAG: penicillin acylase family protein [Halolamina sp.]